MWGDGLDKAEEDAQSEMPKGEHREREEKAQERRQKAEELGGELSAGVNEVRSEEVVAFICKGQAWARVGEPQRAAFELDSGRDWYLHRHGQIGRRYAIND